jgi:hypothetical protein
MRKHHGGEEKRETDEQKAERLVLVELEKRGWADQDWSSTTRLTA